MQGGNNYGKIEINYDGVKFITVNIELYCKTNT